MKRGALRLPRLPWIALGPLVSWTGSATAQADSNPASSPAGGGVLTTAAGVTPGRVADRMGENVFLIDRHLPDSALLVRAVSPGSRVFVYDSARESAVDVLSRVVTWAEAARVGIASLSILSHGAPGAFELGNQWVTATSAALTPAIWRGLGGVLAPGARINLFGCNVAAPGSNG